MNISKATTTIYIFYQKDCDIYISQNMFAHLVLFPLPILVSINFRIQREKKIVNSLLVSLL